VLMLIACQGFDADATTDPQGNRIHRCKSSLQFVTVVAGQSTENDHDVDVTIRPGIPSGFRTEEDNRVQPFAVGLRKPFLEFNEYPGRDHSEVCPWPPLSPPEPSAFR